MGSVGIWDGFRIMVNTDDHEPAHVHVVKAGKTIVVYLDGFGIKVMYGSPNTNERRRAVEIVKEHIEECWIKWTAIHAPKPARVRKARGS